MTQVTVSHLCWFTHNSDGRPTNPWLPDGWRPLLAYSRVLFRHRIDSLRIAVTRTMRHNIKTRPTKVPLRRMSIFGLDWFSLALNRHSTSTRTMGYIHHHSTKIPHGQMIATPTDSLKCLHCTSSPRFPLLTLV